MALTISAETIYSRQLPEALRKKYVRGELFSELFSGLRFSEVAPFPRGDLQTRAMRQPVPDQFFRPLHL